MDFNDTAEEAAFRKEVRAWLKANRPKKKELASILNIPKQYEILLVIALGKPAEEVVIDSTDSNGDIKYWRDKNDVHHVPKRPLDEIIIN